MENDKLILSLKARNPEAFQILVEQFGTKVYNTALGIIQHAEDAEDVSQEVFIQVFQSIGNFRGDSLLSTWIYRITISKSLEFLRKKKQKKRFGFFLDIFGKEATSYEVHAATFYHPGVELENKERTVILFKAIDQLPENQKTAFVLHKIENLSYAEVAEVMKITTSTVESLMFRAKKGLRSRLSDYYEKNER